MKIGKKSILVTVAGALFLTSCMKEVFVPGTDNSGSLTHGNGYAPNYDVVFKENTVHRLDISIDADEWEDMQENLSTLTSSGGPPGQFSDENPEYFHCTINYNGLTWNNVGIRYKGNSSLRARSGKLPLRLDFDKWEYEDESVWNQRFYGFKELSLSSNYNDASLMREKTADDLFRHFGVPAVRSAFYEIYIDKGSGPEYYGVYTMVEVVFDTFLENWFGSSRGNCYKPDGDGASWASTSFNLADFELKTNEEINDKSDITEMFDILHASNRTSDPVAWRNYLEAVFDVEGFLKYLAVNNTIQNWDTYGRMTHNYYLYHDPADDLIKWIAWDNNEAFEDGKMGGSLSFAMTEVGTNWPLINYVINDTEYELKYKSYIKSFIETSFENGRMNGIYGDQQTLLTTSANNERSGYSYVNGQFTSAVSTLKSHNASRIAAANAYLQ